jgi:hypothetical protein
MKAATPAFRDAVALRGLGMSLHVLSLAFPPCRRHRPFNILLI